MDLLRPVATTYLRAHAYEELLAMVSKTPLGEGAAWQRTFLFADLLALLGNADDAARLCKQLPDPAQRDPVVRKFRGEQPALFGDNPLQPPPGVDSEPPQERVRSFLNSLEPGKAWEVIAANADAFLDDLEAWHQLTPQFADQNLVPRLLPLLTARANQRPDDWELRLTLAQFQLLAGDTEKATANFRQLYAAKPDDPLLSPSPSERAAAMEGMTLGSVRRPDDRPPFSRVKTVENARDFALICLAGLADEHREGEKFIHDLQEEYRGDQTGWITALMLVNAPALVLRELRTCLAEGPPPDLDALALPWLQANHNRSGPEWLQPERKRLADLWAQRQPATAAQSPAGRSNPMWQTEARLAEILKSGDPAAKEKYLTELIAADDPRSKSMAFAMFLHRASVQPDDQFSLRAAALLFAGIADEMDREIALHALDHQWN